MSAKQQWWSNHLKFSVRFHCIRIDKHKASKNTQAGYLVVEMAPHPFERSSPTNTVDTEYATHVSFIRGDAASRHRNHCSSQDISCLSFAWPAAALQISVKKYLGVGQHKIQYGAKCDEKSG